MERWLDRYIYTLWFQIPAAIGIFFAVAVGIAYLTGHGRADGDLTFSEWCVVLVCMPTLFGVGGLALRDKLFGEREPAREQSISDLRNDLRHAHSALAFYQGQGNFDMVGYWRGRVAEIESELRERGH